MEENRIQSNEALRQQAVENSAAGQAVATGEIETRVWDALRECYDPEIPVNIVELGLVYGVKIEDEIPGEMNVYVTMTLTAPGCGLAPMIAADVKRRVQQVPGVRNVLVELTFDPPWNPSMMTEAAKLQLNMV